MTYDPEWLAITRAFHPFLSLTPYQTPLPPLETMKQMVSDELDRLKEDGLLVPALPELGIEETDQASALPKLVWEKGNVEVGRVQVFWPTAPAEGQPGGSPSESQASALNPNPAHT